MNLLTFDIEEWHIEKYFHGGNAERYAQFEKVVDNLLNLLTQTQKRATFFCVGKMGEDFPEIINKIAQRGHEIGCHSYIHTWLNKMTEQECRHDTRQAVDALEQCVGKKIKSYRAPAYSVCADNQWVFEILQDCGITADSSVYPSPRDFGGFPNFPSRNPILLKLQNGESIMEFPIKMTKILGKEMAFSGGGYFRFFPYRYIHSNLNNTDYGICYFHIADLLNEHAPLMTKEEYEVYFKERGTWTARMKRYVKENLGRKSAWRKLEKLLQKIDFQCVEDAVTKYKTQQIETFDLPIKNVERLFNYRKVHGNAPISVNNFP